MTSTARRRARFGLLVLALLWAGPAAASQVLYGPLEVLVDEADVVVWGRVTHARSHRDAANPGRIRTDVTVSPLERLKSDGAARPLDAVSVSLPQGRSGPYVQVGAGLPDLSPGDEVVLLLYRQRSGRLVLLGMALGAYVVDRRGPKPSAVSDRRGLTLRVRDALGRLVPAPPAASVERLPLADLLTRIRARTAGAK